MDAQLALTFLENPIGLGLLSFALVSLVGFKTPRPPSHAFVNDAPHIRNVKIQNRSNHKASELVEASSSCSISTL